MESGHPAQGAPPAPRGRGTAFLEGARNGRNREGKVSSPLAGSAPGRRAERPGARFRTQEDSANEDRPRDICLMRFAHPAGGGFPTAPMTVPTCAAKAGPPRNRPIPPSSVVAQHPYVTARLARSSSRVLHTGGRPDPPRHARKRRCRGVGQTRTATVPAQVRIASPG